MPLVPVPCPVPLVLPFLERGDRPPADAELPGGLPDLGQRLESGRAQVDGSLAAAGGVHPGSVEEFLAGPDQVIGPGPDPLGIAGQDEAARGNVVEQQLHPVGQHRRERFHALDRDAVRQLAQDFGQSRIFLRELPGPLAYFRGEQQLPAGRCPQPLRGGVQTALVGGPEVADLLDRVPPEFHPEGMLLGGREHIQDAAADRDLATMLDQVGARVPDVHQVRDDLLEVGRLAAPQGHWLQVTQTAHHRLQQAAHRGDQHTEGTGPDAAGVRVGEPAQHGQPPPRRIRARREPFVREGLPGREAGHRALR